MTKRSRNTGNRGSREPAKKPPRVPDKPKASYRVRSAKKWAKKEREDVWAQLPIPRL